MSPDGQTVCSGAADETLRLWECFTVDVTKKRKEKTMESRSNTNSKLFSAIRWYYMKTGLDVEIRNESRF